MDLLPPEVTVIIPTRDRWELLSAALASALRQRDVALEVIVVDDGSVDDTYPKLVQLGDPRVRVARHETPLGVARARNSGLDKARGGWVAFLDDDDVWAPQKLRVQLDRAADLGASFVFCSAVAFNEDNGLQRRLPAACPDDLSRVILERNVIGLSTVIARTELVRKVGGFDPNLSLISDWDLWIRLADSTAAACNEPLVGYRLHQDNMHATARIDEVRREYQYLASKHRAQYGDLDLSARYASAVAWTQYRAGRRLLASWYYLRAGLASGEALRRLGIHVGEQMTASARRARGRAALEADWLHPSPEQEPPPLSTRGERRSQGLARGR